MEHYDSQQEYAGFKVRFGATLIDTIILVAITSPILYSIYGEEYWASNALYLGVPDFLVSHVFPLVATVLFWIYKAATPGKIALNLKVVDAVTGGLPTTKQSIIRYIGYYISLLPLGLGYIWVIFDSKRQSWHDKMAGTVVIGPGVEKVAFTESQNQQEA